jgi:hypothetical protein
MVLLPRVRITPPFRRPVPLSVTAELESLAVAALDEKVDASMPALLLLDAIQLSIFSSAGPVVPSH